MQPSQCFPQWINQILVLLQKKDWRGKHRFYLWLSKRYGHKVILHPIGSREFAVPVGELCFWLEGGPENYYLDEFTPFCELLNQTNSSFSFFDLGADIGTVSSLVAVNCTNIANIIAFEPNPKSFDILESNLSNINSPYAAINAAISDYVGQACFHADPQRINDHEGYIDKNPEGDTPVTSLDVWCASQTSLVIEKTVVLKIDVEGQEIQAMLGAKNLIESSEKVIILIEIHPDVLARTQQCAEDLFIIPEQFRDFTWTVPLHNGLTVDRQRPLFEQVPHGQYDIIGVSN